MTILITMAELTGKTEAELAAVHRHMTCILNRSAPGTPERRNAIASLENIARSRRALLASRQGPTP
ncbi:MAG: hypothetical protein QNJ84_02150 [Alphaproteobacteria bacterium]|nr:hypothetical protein [Alphaproteobacteria bacterium]